MNTVQHFLIYRTIISHLLLLVNKYFDIFCKYFETIYRPAANHAAYGTFVLILWECYTERPARTRLGNRGDAATEWRAER